MGENRQWETGRTQRIADDIIDALRESEPEDITESKLPIKLVVALLCFAVTNVASVAGVYYDLRGDIRSISESQEALNEVLTDKDLDSVKVEIQHLKDGLATVETNMDTPPTSIDHLRAIGSIRTDLRVLEQRVNNIERSISK